MRLLSILALCAALLLVGAPDEAQAGPSSSGIGLPYDPGPIYPIAFLPDLIPQRVTYTAYRLGHGQIQPQVLVSNRGLGSAGRFSVVVNVYWTQDGVRRHRQFRSRVYGLRARQSTLRAFPVIDIGRGNRATVQYTVDPIAHNGNDFAPRGYGEVRELYEGNNLLVETRRAR
ncbi:MAG: hypothetical protein QNJ98_01100 [Planctomycetota bacterium]|nr:hypothetical protein [Planctomycetota bacterium]